MNDDSLSDVTRIIGLDFGRNPAVIPFKPRVVTPEVTPSNQNTPNPAIVKMFEEFLRRAREGKIKWAAIAVVSDDMVAYSTWEPEEKTTPQLLSAALGSVAYLSHRFGRACDDGANYEVSDSPPPG